jgi:hypothetical protein
MKFSKINYSIKTCQKPHTLSQNRAYFHDVFFTKLTCLISNYAAPYGGNELKFAVIVRKLIILKKNLCQIWLTFSDIDFIPVHVFKIEINLD